MRKTFLGTEEISLRPGLVRRVENGEARCIRGRVWPWRALSEHCVLSYGHTPMSLSDTPALGLPEARLSPLRNREQYGGFLVGRGWDGGSASHLLREKASGETVRE